tara:strand:- start:330 stop:2681 length:2352 start_codon:yes stop_codon:yes gene_type:complete
MKVLLSWLKEFAPIDGEPDLIGEQLSELGLAVENMVRTGEHLEGVVVAKILDLRPHPDADRIQIVEVDSGDGQPLQICCGAFNMSPGDFVPLATIGTIMPNGMEISRRKLRGEWSNGMLCSGAEIDLGDDHDGILILGSESEQGTPLADSLGIESDVLYDLEVNPNRPDAMAVAGVARDLAAYQKVPFKIPVPKVSEKGKDVSEILKAEIISPDLCGRFAVRVIDGISIQDSPQWLKNRITALGMRPVNNVVDVSNYVMLELGQPSHTFDLGCVTGSEFKVRWAADGEEIVTLDGVARSLTEQDGVVADGSDLPIGIAGVMGGVSTEISESTSTVALEMAWWNPAAIAKTSRRLGLRSEASARFERGTDPEIIDMAMQRFCELLGPEAFLSPGIIDTKGHLPAGDKIKVRVSRVNGILGTDLDQKDILKILDPIGFKGESVDQDIDVKVPSFRPDTSSEIDVIEEIARIYGYERIMKTVPKSKTFGSLTLKQSDCRLIRTTMVGLGLDEAMPIPFLAPGELENAGLESDGIKVANPLVAEESIMRSSLRPGLLKTLAYNESHRLTGLRLFELGHVYRQPDKFQALPDEREQLVSILAGSEAGEIVKIWSALADALGFDDYELLTDSPPGFHATRTSRIEVQGVTVGFLGEIDPSVLSLFEVNERVACLEVDIDDLLSIPHGHRSYAPFSRYPSSDIDLAFEVDEGVSSNEVKKCLQEQAGPLLVGIHLFDIFRGEPVAEGRRSLAFKLRLQADDRTLTNVEVAEVHGECIKSVEKKFSAKLRS